MKALQARCNAKEAVVCRQHTHLEYEANQLNQYKKAAHILNVELIEKNAQLKKANYRCEELAKANTNMTTKLAALREQIEQAKVDIVAGF